MTEHFLQEAGAEENNAPVLLTEIRMRTKTKPEARLLTELTETQRQLALERFRLLRPHLEEGKPLAQIAAQQNVPLRTLQRWAAHYRQTGLTGLARQARTDKGSHRLLSAEERQLIEGLALQKAAFERGGDPPPYVRPCWGAGRAELCPGSCARSCFAAGTHNFGA